MVEESPTLGRLVRLHPMDFSEDKPKQFWQCSYGTTRRRKYRSLSFTQVGIPTAGGLITLAKDEDLG